MFFALPTHGDELPDDTRCRAAILHHRGAFDDCGVDRAARSVKRFIKSGFNKIKDRLIDGSL